MRKFTVHRNGTSANELKQQQIAIMNAARALEAALRNSYPNMRDYYINDDGVEDQKADSTSLNDEIFSVQNIYNHAQENAMRAIEQGEAHGD